MKLYEYDIVKAMDKAPDSKREITTGLVLADFGKYKIYISFEGSEIKLHKTGDTPESIIVSPSSANVILVK